MSLLPFWKRRLKLDLIRELCLFAKSRSNISLMATAFSAVAILCAVSLAQAAEPASKERSRLEELFIWKTSEELKLSPSVEQKFTETIQSLNKRRREANAKMDAVLSQLAQAKTKADAEKALTAHRAALRDVQAVQTIEIDKLRPLLGPEKLAQYITVKSSILDKLKTMLAAPSATPASASGPQAVSPQSTASVATPTATPPIPSK